MAIQCGVGAVPLRFPDGVGLAGYGPFAGEGYGDDVAHPVTGLMARALHLERIAEGGTTSLFLVVVDLMGSSLRIQQRVVDALVARGIATDDAHLFILASHTHSAPGQYFGNSLYDAFSQNPGGHRADVADVITAAVIEACALAHADKRAARVAVVSEVGWGLGRNRSLAAFESNFAPDERDGTWFPRWLALLGLAGQGTAGDVYQRAVDPRLWTLWAFEADRDAVIGTLAAAACHNASLGRDHRFYDADWAGRAAHRMRSHDVPWAAVVQGAAGDVTAIPSLKDMRAMGTALADSVADSVVATWLASRPGALSAASDDLVIDVGLHRWRPGDDGLDRWDVGQPVIDGCEESRSPWFSETRGEPRTSRVPWGLIEKTLGVTNEQAPKVSAFGLLQPAVRRLFSDLAPAPEHPLSLVRLGSHLFFVLPCEVTGFAAARIARRLADATSGVGIASVSPLAIGNDYAGYLTTEAEYDAQHYEGAHNLFGRRSLAVIEHHLESLVGPGGLRVDGRARLPHPEPLTAAEFERRVVSVLQLVSAPLRVGAVLGQGLGLLFDLGRKNPFARR